MRKILLFCIISVFVFSCKNQTTREIENFDWKDYAITIETYGCLPGSARFKAIIYNEPQYYMLNYDFFKPHFLYLISEYDSISDATSFELTEELEDSIYFLVNKYLSDFYIDNSAVCIEGIDKKIYSYRNYNGEEAVEDGACLNVMLQYDNKMMKCGRYNLSSIENASPEIKKLMEIINSRVDKKFRMY
jgi:hypothetical protein